VARVRRRSSRPSPREETLNGGGLVWELWLEWSVGLAGGAGVVLLLSMLILLLLMLLLGTGGTGAGPAAGLAGSGRAAAVAWACAEPLWEAGSAAGSPAEGSPPALGSSALGRSPPSWGCGVSSGSAAPSSLGSLDGAVGVSRLSSGREAVALEPGLSTGLSGGGFSGWCGGAVAAASQGVEAPAAASPRLQNLWTMFIAVLRVRFALWMASDMFLSKLHSGHVVSPFVLLPANHTLASAFAFLLPV